MGKERPRDVPARLSLQDKAQVRQAAELRTWITVPGVRSREEEHISFDWPFRSLTCGLTGSKPGKANEAL